MPTQPTVIESGATSLASEGGGSPPTDAAAQSLTQEMRVVFLTDPIILGSIARMITAALAYQEKLPDLQSPITREIVARAVMEHA